MREFFSQHGKVVDSTVMVDRETGRSKGFGFITFEDTNVEPILGFGKLEIDGKMVSQ
jgi:RNA-binding protein Musashi